MSRLHDTGESFGEGNVTLLMILGVISYGQRMQGAIAGAVARGRAARSAGQRARDADARADRRHPLELAVLGIESFGMSVAGLCGPDDHSRRDARRRGAARPPAGARPAARSLRRVMR